MSTDSTQGTNTYYTDPESAPEMARLIKQAHMLTEEMGGPLADHKDLTHIHDILDLACGPGEWVLELASMYPEKQVTGVDISQRMLEYAQLQALRNQLHNAHFREMDILKQPLEFSPHTFDLINMRLISSMFRTPNHWLKLLQECMRVTRPGGFIYLTDCECYISNSPIAEKFFALCTKAAYLAGNSFSADGRQLAITPMMGRLLRQAGYQNVQHRAFAIDGSAGAKNHQQFYEDIVVFLKFVQPILVRTGVVATPEEAETLYYQTLEEMRAEDFNCIWYFLTVCGEKAVTD